MILSKLSIDAVKSGASDEESLHVVADFLRRYYAGELSARNAMFGVARCMIAWASSCAVASR